MLALESIDVVLDELVFVSLVLDCSGQVLKVYDIYFVVQMALHVLKVDLLG